MTKLKTSLIAAALATSCVSSGTVNATDIKLSGFLNVIGATHDADDMHYVESIDDSLGFGGSNFGLNLASKLDDNISVAAQFFATGNGDNAVIDWAFAKYRFNDASTAKLGKIKYAGSLYSETVDVGLLYPWVRAPESIYFEGAELSFEAYEGASYKYTGGDDTEFAFEVYYGSTDEEEREDGGVESRKQMLGIVLTAEGEFGKAILGYNSSTGVAIDSGKNPINEHGATIDIISIGVETSFNNLQLLAEASQSQHSGALSTEDKLGWYATAAYSFGEWKPHFTIQEISKDDKKIGQSSLTLGLNRQLTPSSIIKFEVQQIDDIIGNGFFEERLITAALKDGESVNVFQIAFNLVF